LEEQVPHSEHLGLFDTPPRRREVWLSVSLVGMLAIVGLLVSPVISVPVGESPPFIPVIHSITFACDLIIATMLYAQAMVLRTRSLMLLASGFVVMGLLVVPYVLTYPGAFAPNGLFGDGTNTPAWLMLFRRFGFPLLVVCYALLARRERTSPLDMQRQAPRAFVWVLGAVAIAAAATALVTFRPDWLPPVFSDRIHTNESTLLAINTASLVAALAAIGALVRKNLSLLDIWLIAAQAAWLVLDVFHFFVVTRFTVGFYVLHFVLMASHLLVLVALIAEANRSYARLALAMALRKRERDSHLMSVGTMAATFAHEIGQPLAAVSTHAAAGLSWLARPEPNVAKGIEALRGVLDSAQRINAVTRSLRAIIAEKPGTISEFNVNDLAWQSASLLERELAAARVDVRLDLDPDTPPVKADRVQLQQVLLNLMVNAIDAMREAPGGFRRITLHSAPLADGGTLLKVSDTGAGIAESDLEHIFEPFVTTKQFGTGLGLAICRTIVEEYGGRLWASNDNGQGATFHIQLPNSSAAIAVAAE